MQCTPRQNGTGGALSAYPENAALKANLNPIRGPRISVDNRAIFHARDPARRILGLLRLVIRDLMDFMWVMVAVAISGEVVRLTYQQCYAKKKTNATDNGLEEPLFLRADGTCPCACCAKEDIGQETDIGDDTGESSDETVSDEVVSSEEIEEEYTVSVVDNWKATHLVQEDWMHETAGRIYPAGPGRPKVVHFKVSEIGGVSAARKEVSDKIHPQPSGEATDQAHNSVGTSSYKDKRSYDHTALPPIQEVMSGHHGNIPGDGDGQCSYQGD